MHKILAVCMLVLVVVAAAGGFFLFQALEQSAKQSRPSVAGQMLIPVSTQSGSQTTADKPKVYHQAIDIESRSFSFAPNVFRVKMGESVTATVTARGEHTFVVDEFHVDEKTQDGEKATIRFTPDKKGVFSFYCSRPGHRQAGQQGVLIVE